MTALMKKVEKVSHELKNNCKYTDRSKVGGGSVCGLVLYSMSVAAGTCNVYLYSTVTFPGDTDQNTRQPLGTEAGASPLRPRIAYASIRYGANEATIRAR